MKTHGMSMSAPPTAEPGASVGSRRYSSSRSTIRPSNPYRRPYSTSGALTVANSTEEQRDYVYKGLMRWGFSMVVIIPIVTWLIFVVPGWL